MDDTNITEITLFNRTGYILFDEKTLKGVFAYRDIGTMPDGQPFDKLWFCDVYRAEYKGKNKSGFSPIRFNWIKATQRSFNKIGIQPQQLPMLIRLANFIYRQISGENIPEPRLENPLAKLPADEEMIARVMGRTR